DLMLSNPEPMSEGYRSLRALISPVAGFVGGTAHKKSGWRDKHHLGRGALQRSAIKLLWRGTHIEKQDAAKRVGRGAHRSPGCQIRRAEDGVKARRAGDAKPECSVQF